MRQRYIITVYVNGNLMGYVKSVSEVKGTYDVTQRRGTARTFRSEDACMSTIDLLTRIMQNIPCGFSYELL